MKNYLLSVTTTHEASELISDVLISAGADGIVINDKCDVEEVLNNKLFWDYVDDSVTSAVKICEVKVSGYVAENVLDDAIAYVNQEMERVKSLDVGMDMGLLSVSVQELPDVNWFEEWKRYYSVMEIADYVVCPEWESADYPDKHVIKINPGTAFGTGEHDSTKLCLTLLSELDVNAETDVVDIGAGSGILGIGAMIRGARSAYLTDIDPDTLSNARENAALNGVAAKCEFACADLVRGKSGDIVFANITADVLIRLATTLDGVVRPNGKLILSGIINQRLSEVREAFVDAGFSVIKHLNSGEWNALLLKWK